MSGPARPPLIERTVHPIGPRTFVAKGRPGSGPLVVAAGDSITHGFISANWVAALQRQLGPRHYRFVNAGISGDLAWNLLQRLDAVVACQPDVVIVQIGTNDAAAHIDDMWREGYMRDQHLPRLPDRGWFRENLEAIVTRLQSETSARIALVELPLLGEDPDSRFNELAQQFTEVVHAVGASRGVPVLPIRSAMLSALPDHSPAPWDGSKKLMAGAFVRHKVLRRRWDAISDRYGLTLLTDQVHLNERGAAILGAVVTRFLLDASA